MVKIILDSSELTKDEDVEPVILKLKAPSSSDKLSAKSDAQFSEQDVVRWSEIVQTGLRAINSEQVCLVSLYSILTFYSTVWTHILSVRRFGFGLTVDVILYKYILTIINNCFLIICTFTNF